MALTPTGSGGVDAFYRPLQTALADEVRLIFTLQSVGTSRQQYQLREAGGEIYATWAEFDQQSWLASDRNAAQTSD